ncbi:MAG: hypothetical protein AAF639_35280, partial [Chloroflexota bacterium]
MSKPNPQTNIQGNINNSQAVVIGEGNTQHTTTINIGYLPQNPSEPTRKEWRRSLWAKEEQDYCQKLIYNCNVIGRNMTVDKNFIDIEILKKPSADLRLDISKLQEMGIDYFD